MGNEECKKQTGEKFESFRSRGEVEEEFDSVTCLLRFSVCEVLWKARKPEVPFFDSFESFLCLPVRMRKKWCSHITSNYHGGI